MEKVRWEDFDGSPGRRNDRIEVSFSASGGLNISRRLVKELGLTEVNRGVRFSRCAKDGEIIGKLAPAPKNEAHRLVNISSGSGHCSAKRLAEFFGIVLPAKGRKAFAVTRLGQEGLIFQAKEPRQADAMAGRKAASAAGQLADARRKS